MDLEVSPALRLMSVHVFSDYKNRWLTVDPQALPSGHQHGVFRFEGTATTRVVCGLSKALDRPDQPIMSDVELLERHMCYHMKLGVDTS